MENIRKESVCVAEVVFAISLQVTTADYSDDGTSLPERIKKDTWPTAIHLLSDPSELFSARKATDDMYHRSERQIQTLPCFYLVP